MALEKLTQDVANISKLDNYPPDDPGMTPDKLKQLFDKGSVTIKDYINNVLIPQLEAGFIDSIARTSGDGSPGTTDTYTITFHDGSTKTFQIYNGRDGIDGEKGDKGDTGNGIASAVLNEDYTLTLTFTDGTSYTTPSIRGAKGDKGDKGDKGEKGDKGDKGDTGAGLEFDWNGTQLGVRVEGDGAYQYVDLKGETGPAGRGIASVTKKSGTGAPGTYDTYTITFTDGTTFDFQVYNGANGEGSGDMMQAVYDPTGRNTDIFGYVDNKVKTDVPAGAKFTDTVTTINGKTGAITKADIVALGIPAQDTVYTHPATHSADMIVDGTTNKAYTATEKNKLAGIETGANKTIIANNLTETIPGKALDATQGKVLADLIDSKASKSDVELIDSKIPEIKVGDIKITTLADVGEDWLLCNGDAVSKESYPDLYALLGLPGAWTANNQGSNYLQSVAYGNGYWVAVGELGTLYYKADTPVGTWTANSHGSNYLRGVTYNNGYWVAVGGDGTLYYKADTPVGTWTANKQGSANLYDVAYGNGYWVTVGDNGTLYYRANTPAGTWTANKQGSADLYDVAYGNGYWVTVGDNGTLYYKADTPVGEWTANKQGSANLYDVAYGNGFWVAVGTSDGALYYKADTPVGEWTANKQGSANLLGVTYGNGFWVAVGSDGTLYYKADTPVGEWTANKQGSNYLRRVAYSNGYWVVVGSGGTLYYKTKALPTITLDGAYAYIRAK